MSCSDYPTAADAKRFKLDAETINEVVTSDEVVTSPASDGERKITLRGIEQEVINTLDKSYVGEWQQGATTFSSFNEYAVFNSQTYRPRNQSGINFPYVALGADPTQSPDVEFIQPFNPTDYGTTLSGHEVKHRRGNQAEIDNFTGAIGEIVVNTTEDELVLGNGATRGGVPIAKKSNTVLRFGTLADAVTNTALKEGFSVMLKERTAGSGGGGVWNVVGASSVIANTYDIVQCTGVPSLALSVEIDNPHIDVTKLGALTDGSDNAGVVTRAAELSNDSNKPIYFPGSLGEYIIGSTVPYYSKGLIGDGRGNSIVKFTGSGVCFDRKASFDFGEINGLTLKGTGKTGGQTLMRSLEASAGWFRTRIQNVLIRDIQSGLFIDQSLFHKWDQVEFRDVGVAVFFAGDRETTSFPGGWNTTWFNNQIEIGTITFTGCDMCIDYIGNGLKIENITCQSGIDGVKIQGKFGAGSNNRIGTYYAEFNTGKDIELVSTELMLDNYFSFADANSNTVGIYCDDAKVTSLGKNQFSDTHQWRLQLLNSSRFIQMQERNTFLTSVDGSSEFVSLYETAIMSSSPVEQVINFLSGVPVEINNGLRLQPITHLTMRFPSSSRTAISINLYVEGGSWKGFLSGPTVAGNTFAFNGATFTLAVNGGTGVASLTSSNDLEGTTIRYTSVTSWP